MPTPRREKRTSPRPPRRLLRVRFCATVDLRGMPVQFRTGYSSRNLSRYFDRPLFSALSRVSTKLAQPLLYALSRDDETLTRTRNESDENDAANRNQLEDEEVVLDDFWGAEG